jgi:hypothetical protein
MIVYSDCLFPALTMCAAVVETLGHVISPVASASRDMFDSALGRLLEFLRQDSCFARNDVQFLLQVQLRALCPILSTHFALVAQLEASSGIMTHHDNRHQDSMPPPPSDACPWTLVRASCCSRGPIALINLLFDSQLQLSASLPSSITLQLLCSSSIFSRLFFHNLFM